MSRSLVSGRQVARGRHQQYLDTVVRVRVERTEDHLTSYLYPSSLLTYTMEVVPEWCEATVLIVSMPAVLVREMTAPQ